jgi:thiol-disulfide isomerase/thioredoxin
MSRSALSWVLLLALVACQKAPPPPALHATRANEPPDIAWFDGSLQGAFIVAKRENRPVLLYWGAEWCPFCHTLKSTVFSRPDFIAKAKLFLPVYLDGDDEGAQKWGETFAIEGYPTLIVLDPDRHEIIRLGAGRDVSQYAAALDLALEDVHPVDALLRTAAAGQALGLNECRRLAYNSWDLDTIDASNYAQQAGALQTAAAHCPADAQLERADLDTFAAYYQASAESAVLADGKHQPSPMLSELIDQVAQVLAQHDTAVSAAGALGTLDDSFFNAVRARGPKFAAQFADSYIAIMDAAANDPRYVLADQLGFLDAKLRALGALSVATAKQGRAPLPKAAVAAARARIDAALAAEQNIYVRSGLVNAALNILEDIGDYPAAYQIAKAEIGRASAPYYYKADLAEISEKLGHKDEALMLLDEAYQESQGAATRFQWGQLYVSGLLRLAPKDAPRIETAGVQVLSELDGPDRIYLRARVRLEKLNQELRAWNLGAKGAHGDVLQSLRARMQQICVKIPDDEPARASCDAFLQNAG